MITISRGQEPESLRRARERRLKAAIDAFNEHGPGTASLADFLNHGYDIAKRPLWKAQHMKCAYCEQRVIYHEQPTEHFRPKAYALRNWRDDEAIDEDRLRYWWLTWTWENLLFTCTTCNGKSHKGNRFPLAAGSEPLPAPAHPASFPLPAEHFDVTNERPLLLDPADRRLDPLDHLRWRPLEPSLDPAQWEWGVRGISLPGRVTARILRLDERAHFVNAAYKDVVWPRFRNEVYTRPTRRRPDIVAAWDKLVRDLVSPEAEFAAARWSMLDTLRTCSDGLRRLELPAPPRPSPSGE